MAQPTKDSVTFLLFVVHGMGGLSDGFLQNVKIMEQNITETLTKDLSVTNVNVMTVPIDWHSKLHELDTVDKLMNRCNLPTCGSLRKFNNEVMADVLYYFTSFHGQRIRDIVVSEMNAAYKRISKTCESAPKVCLMGHSLGGIIVYDIIAHQIPPQSRTKSHLDGQVQKLCFKPSHCFSLGSPVSACLIMRGQTFSEYQPPEWCVYENIFHLYDPLGYRIEPLIHQAYVNKPPVLLQRKPEASRIPLDYYTSLLKSYFDNYVRRIFPSPGGFGMMLPSFPPVSMTNFMSFYGTGESAGATDPSPIATSDSASNMDDFINASSTVPKDDDELDSKLSSRKQEPSHKRKREETEQTEDTPKKPKEHQDPAHDVSQRKILVPKSTLPRAFVESLTVQANGLIQNTIAPVMQRVRTSFSFARLSQSPILEEDSHHELNEEDVVPILERRYDYYVQEMVIENMVHQYFVGMRAHMAYVTNKDVIHHILSRMIED